MDDPCRYISSFTHMHKARCRHNTNQRVNKYVMPDSILVQTITIFLMKKQSNEYQDDFAGDMLFILSLFLLRFRTMELLFLTMNLIKTVSPRDEKPHYILTFVSILTCIGLDDVTK